MIPLLSEFPAKMAGRWTTGVELLAKELDQSLSSLVDSRENNQ